MKDYVIGIDVGGTRLKSGAVTRRGTLLAENITASGAHRGPQALQRAIAREVGRISNRMARKPAGVGIALPGAIKPDRGVVLLPGRLHGLEGYPLVPRLRKQLRAPVVAENDGRVSIVAEKHYGLARRKKWAVTITLGTGVGSGVMLDGRILRDPHLQFGTQASHVILQAAGGRKCITGPRGTAETLCSATALAMAVREGMARGIPSVLLNRFVADPASIDFEAVMYGVSRRDALCVEELEAWKANLAAFLVSTIHAYAPEVVILSGGAVNGAKHFLASVRRLVNGLVFRWPAGDPVPILVSKLRDHAGVMGAAAVAWEHGS